jgi:hypothetical protein
LVVGHSLITIAVDFWSYKGACTGQDGTNEEENLSFQYALNDP